MPLGFEANRGQVDSRAKFVARGRGMGLFFTEQGAVLALTKPTDRAAPHAPGSRLAPELHEATPQNRQALGLRYHFAQANAHPKIEALDPLPGHSNYFIGNDPKHWRTDIAQYQRVRYRDIYPGVNVVYYGKDGQLEFDVEAAPGADLAQVRLQVDGADSFALDNDGNLQLHTALGTLVQAKPVVYQMIAGERRELHGDYLLRDIRLDGSAHEVAFSVPAYDAAYALVLDPTLVFATLIGGSGKDDGTGVAVDGSGNSYVTGYTNSINFPTTTGAYQTATAGAFDAFVVKINAAGTAKVYSTLIGGNNSDYAYGIGIDSAGKAYITGYTVSSNFPTINALQATNPGVQSGFVTALNAAGNGLIYSTYLGGNGGGICFAIAVDSAGDAYLTGLTTATNLPVSVGAFQTNNAGGNSDAFVFKFNPAGGRVYGTYLGGAATDEGRAIAVDHEGNAYIAGGTGSATFNGVNPAVIGPLGGTFAMLIATVNPTGTGLIYATKIGGDMADEAIGIAVDGGHQVYFTAFSNSSNLPPATPPQHTGVNEAYIGHLDDSGTVLKEFTWYGATDGTQDYGYAVNLDEARQALYVVGQIQSYPTANSLGNTPSINPVTGLDCATACAATTGAFLLQYTTNPLALASATRVTGGSATNAIFTAVAHDPVTGHAAAVGSSDGNPPTTVVTQGITSGSTADSALPTMNAGGDDFVDALINYPYPGVLPLVIDKYFTPAEAIKGQEVDLTFVVTNPNFAGDIDYILVSDTFPKCLSGHYRSPVFNPSSCSDFFATYPTSGKMVFGLRYGSTYPPRMECTITIKVQAIGPEPCENVTQTVLSSLGTSKPAKATLRMLSPPISFWNGPGPDTNIGVNWISGAVPANGNDWIFPGGVQTTVTNNLPAGQTTNLINLYGTGYNLNGGTVNLLAGVNNSWVNTFSAPIKAISSLVFSSNPAGAVLNLSGGVNLNGNNIDLSGVGSTFVSAAVGGIGNVGIDGPGSVTLGASPSFNGNLYVGGGTLYANTGVSQPIGVLFSGVLRGTGPFGAVTVDNSGTVFPGTNSTPATLSLASLAINSGFFESAFTANNASYSSLTVSGTTQLNGGTLKLDLGTAPTVGTVFSNLIMAPGTLSGCFGEAIATPPNVLVKAQCTASAASAIVIAVDDIFHNGFN